MNRIIPLFVFGLVGPSAFASGTPNQCGVMKTPTELYQCSTSKHPDNLVVERTHTAASAAAEKAGRFLNPELEVKNTGGKNSGEKVAALEMTLSFPVSDYLLARGARKQLGAAEKLQMDTEAREVDFDLKRQVLKDMYRYRQLLAEEALLGETLTTLANIERQFRSRRARGPEQEITLNLVVLAQSDYELKKNHLIVEKQEIESRFRVIWGDLFTLEKTQLPPYKKTWPKLTPKFDPANHFELQKLLAERNRNAGELNAAWAETWPAIKIGPVFERNAEGANAFSNYGVLLSVELPIFSWNQGGRTFAEAQKAKTDSQYEVAARRAVLENDLVYKKYEASIQALTRSEDRENLAKKHSAIDNLFRQGLTSGSTIIEAHRQIWEFTASQHEHEMTAIESLMALNQLMGKDVAEVLQ